jgi:hypothetical protein
MEIGYEELDRRSKLLSKESSKIIGEAISKTCYSIKGLRYSEIEIFLQLLERNIKMESYFRGYGFEKVPLV